MSGKTKTAVRRSQFLALFCGLLTAALLFVAFAYMLVRWELSQAAVPAMVLGTLGIGTAVGGWLSAYLRGSSGLTCGFVVGAVYGSILLLWSYYRNQSILETSPIYIACIFVSGCISGYLGMIAAEKRSRRHR